MARHVSMVVGLVAFLTVGLLTGCSTTTASAPTPISTAREGLSGDWSGPWASGAYSGTVDAELVQRGSTLSGHGVVSGHPSLSRVSISGVVQGDRASGTFSASSVPDMPFHVTINGNRMDGSLGQGRVSLQRNGPSVTRWRGPSRPPSRLGRTSSPRMTRFTDCRGERPSATVSSWPSRFRANERRRVMTGSEVRKRVVLSPIALAVAVGVAAQTLLPLPWSPIDPVQANHPQCAIGGGGGGGDTGASFDGGCCDCSAAGDGGGCGDGGK